MTLPNGLRSKARWLDQRGFCDSAQDMRVAADELDRLQAENEALRKDAERYRWLRNGYDHCDDGLPYAVRHAQNDWGKWVTPVIVDEALDAAIDTAREVVA
jgi:hypothetical protein